MKPFKRSFLWILVFMTIWVGDRSEAATKKSGAKSKASTTLTLKEAQEEAVENSPYYQRSQAVEREMSWEQLEAVGEGFLPHLSLGGQHFLTEQYSYLNVAFGAFPPSQFPGISSTGSRISTKLTRRTAGTKRPNSYRVGPSSKYSSGSSSNSIRRSRLRCFLTWPMRT